MKRHGRHYVYILKCRDGTYYTGYTADLKTRMETHHKKRGAKYLRGRLPAALVFVRKYGYYKNALRAEREIKKLSRKKKEELILK